MSIWLPVFEKMERMDAPEGLRSPITENMLKDGKWGLSWYDSFSQPEGFMWVGQDFGSIDHVIYEQELHQKNMDLDVEQMEQLIRKNDPSYEFVAERLDEKNLKNQCFLTNALLFVRYEGKKASGDIADRYFVSKQTKELLREQIRIAKPRIIASLGTYADLALSQLSKQTFEEISYTRWMEDGKSYEIEVDDKSIKVLPLPHPSPCNRTMSEADKIGYYNRFLEKYKTEYLGSSVTTCAN